MIAVMEFGKETFEIIDGGAVGVMMMCRQRKCIAYLDLIEGFLKDRSEKRSVGTNFQYNHSLDMWEDDHNVHIGCLKESKESFQKKYIELKRNINNYEYGKSPASDGYQESKDPQSEVSSEGRCGA